MKKVLSALCAILMLGAIACTKENTNPENVTPSGGGNGNGTERPTIIPTGEGIFNPAQKIVSISVDGEETELWVWTDSMLTSIKENDGTGYYEETASFEYDNYRLTNMLSIIEGAPIAVEYSYANDKLSTIAAGSGPIELMNCAFSRNPNGKVEHVTIDINDMVISMLPQFLGDEFPFPFKGNTKLGFTDITASADLTWQGENVEQAVLNIQLDGDITLGEIRARVNLDSLAGNYASMLLDIPDTLPIPLNINIMDTMIYSYDNHSNPFFGFLGTPDVTHFSANNVTSMTTRGTALLTATFNLGFMTVPFTIPYPLGNNTQTFTYTYNTSGFPLTVTDSEGSVKQYNYLQ